ncbi:AbiJ-NTD4 domain-containing protein [Acinetobacter pittii]|uniref:AbiJ-NTD4 domain-containing protein n=1 Tax=Acinetobacter pittii TaxID=48296 RepID=UPI00300D44F9
MYSERVNGSKPRTKEDICPSMWKGIVTILETLESQNYFAQAFPETCPDSGENCGTDVHKLNNTLNAYLEIEWPLVTSEPKEHYWEEDKPWAPNIDKVFDLIEFLYLKVSEPVKYHFHQYFGHHHLDFKQENGRYKYKEDINTLFRIRGMVYEMNHIGQIEKIISDETKDLIQHVLLKKSFDNQLFKVLIENEMKELTEIGNTYRIRHSEPKQATLQSHDQIDYLFHRCLSMIDLVIYRTHK